MRSAMWAWLCETRPGWRRWVWLLCAPAWVLLLQDRLVHSPYETSSLSVPYVYLAVVPALAFALHGIYPSLITWLPVASLFVLGWGLGALRGLEETLGFWGGKWTTSEVAASVAALWLGSALASSIVWYLRPRPRSPVQSGSMTGGGLGAGDRRGRALLVALSLLLAATGASAQEADPAAAFDEAVAAAERGDLLGAIARMEMVRAFDPDHLDVLWNLGIWNAALGRHAAALPLWRRYKELDPDDWRVRAKIVQSHQALGELELRDRERAALIEWYDGLEETRRPDQDRYCRDQFEVAGRRVMAFEWFVPSGERRVYYSFAVLDAAGVEDFRYSLGSYDRTTEIARASGDIGPDDRLYHLDRYEEGVHGTLAFFRIPPTYDETKERVVAALAGESKPVGSSRVLDPLRIEDGAPTWGELRIGMTVAEVSRAIGAEPALGAEVCDFCPAPLLAGNIEYRGRPLGLRFFAPLGGTTTLACIRVEKLDSDPDGAWLRDVLVEEILLRLPGLRYAPSRHAPDLAEAERPVYALPSAPGTTIVVEPGSALSLARADLYD